MIRRLVPYKTDIDQAFDQNVTLSVKSRLKYLNAMRLGASKYVFSHLFQYVLNL